MSSALHDEAIRLLLELPSALSQRATRQHRLEQLRQRHPGIGIELVSVPRADGHHADHALLLRDADGVVVKLAALRDQGEPWQVSTAEPWAADTLLSVDDEHLSIHSGILYLDDSLRAPGASLARELENRLLLQSELNRHVFPLEPGDLERIERRFRRHHGLLERSAMVRWLEDKGLSYRDFGDLLALNLRLELLRQRICAQQREAWLADHRQLQRGLWLDCQLPPCSEAQALDWLQEIAVETSTTADAAGEQPGVSLALSARWLAQPQCRVEVVSDWIARRRERLQPPQDLEDEQGDSAHHLPEGWLRLEDGPSGQQHWCCLVQQWSVDASDPDLGELVDQLVFEAWLRLRRSAAKVRWHWP